MMLTYAVKLDKALGIPEYSKGAFKKKRNALKSIFLLRDPSTHPIRLCQV